MVTEKFCFSISSVFGKEEILFLDAAAAAASTEKKKKIKIGHKKENAIVNTDREIVTIFFSPCNAKVHLKHDT